VDFAGFRLHLWPVRSLSRNALSTPSLERRGLKKTAYQTSIVAGPTRRLILKEADMATGTVKWFNTTKGFGFIQPEDGGKDVFVHISAVEKSNMGGLNEGQRLSYELERDRRSGRESAVNLKAV
jgi:CspA family cold shock protein